MIVSPSSSIVHLERVVDLGQRVGRELDVDDRAGDRDDAAVLQLGRPAVSAVMVMAMCSCRAQSSAWLGEQVWIAAFDGVGEEVVGARPAAWRRASAPPTISMISVVIASWRARFIAAAEAGDELVGVVGRGLHRPLAGRVLGRRRVEQRGVDARLDVARQQRGRGSPRPTARTRSAARGSAASLGASASSRRPRGSSGISGATTTSWRAGR